MTKMLNFCAKSVKYPPFIDPKTVIVCADCGMKYLPLDVAFGKMQATVEGASIVRRELAG